MGEGVGVPSREIQRNVRDSDISRIHVNTWSYEDDIDWLSKINPGDSVSVNPQSFGPDDLNHVDSVRIDLYCAW